MGLNPTSRLSGCAENFGAETPRICPKASSGSAASIRSFCIVAAISFLLRIPFLFPGFGLDSDAWRVARTARLLVERGTYEASRLPGYPLQEFATALAWAVNPSSPNILTALFSSIAAGLLTLVARRLNLPHSIWIGLAFAAVPVVYIHSVDCMDYMWATSFLLCAWLCAVSNRPFCAGVTLALASGCRLPSLVMLLPLALICSHHRRTRGVVWCTDRRSGIPRHNSVLLTCIEPVWIEILHLLRGRVSFIITRPLADDDRCLGCHRTLFVRCGICQ